MNDEDFLGVMDWPDVEGGDDDDDDDVNGDDENNGMLDVDGSAMLTDMYRMVMPGGAAGTSGNGGGGASVSSNSSMSSNSSSCAISRGHCMAPMPIPDGLPAPSAVASYNCNDGSDGGGGGDDDGSSTAAKKRKRSVLTQEERAKQNRDRNREHARNTRLRKKKFVEDLKDKVNALATAREKEERDKKVEIARNASIRNLRVQVLQTFLELRGIGELNRSKWETILCEDFTMVQPTTPYRLYDPAEVEIHSGRRIIRGVQGVLNDIASLRAFGEGLCHPSGEGEFKKWGDAPSTSPNAQHQSQQWHGRRRTSVKGAATQTFGGGCDGSSGGVGGDVTDSNGGGVSFIHAESSPTDRVCFVYQLDGELLGEGDIFMCTFKAYSINAVSKGAIREIEVTGSVRSSFGCKTHKLLHLEMTFDVNRVMEQLGKSIDGTASENSSNLATLGGGGSKTAVIGGGSDGGPSPTSTASSTTQWLGGGLPLPPPLVIGNAVTLGGAVTGGGGAGGGGRRGGSNSELEHTDVLKSVIDDIRARRISSTVVDSCDNNGCGSKDYLRLYPLNNPGSGDDSEGVTHFVGVLKKIDSLDSRDMESDGGTTSFGSEGGGEGTTIIGGGRSVTTIVGGGGLTAGGGGGVGGLRRDVKVEDINQAYGFAYGKCNDGSTERNNQNMLVNNQTGAAAVAAVDAAATAGDVSGMTALHSTSPAQMGGVTTIESGGYLNDGGQQLHIQTNEIVTATGGEGGAGAGLPTNNYNTYTLGMSPTSAPLPSPSAALAAVAGLKDEVRAMGLVVQETLMPEFGHNGNLGNMQGRVVPP